MQIIILERYLPVEEKTIKPYKLGGVAGGEKYICQNILFKFAVDVDLSEGQGSLWMYGGAHKDDAKAAKSAGHDLSATFCSFRALTATLQRASLHFITPASTERCGCRCCPLSRTAASRCWLSRFCPSRRRRSATARGTRAKRCTPTSRS